MNRSHIMRTMRVRWDRRGTGSTVFTNELIMVKWLASSRQLTLAGARALGFEAKMAGFFPTICPHQGK